MTFGIAGAAFAALCCFTPILAGLLGLIGLGAVMGYLDYVLLPALAGFLGLALYGLLRRNREDMTICCESKQRGQIGRIFNDDGRKEKDEIR
jgi:mercuric ion transport protein